MRSTTFVVRRRVLVLGLGFFWAAAAQSGTSTQQNPTVTFTTPGVKQVTLRACNEQGCREITRQVVVLDPMPRITGVGTVPSLVGVGQPISLSAQTAGRPSLDHRWTISNAISNVVLTGNPIVWDTRTPGIGTYQVRLEVRNSDGSVLSTPVTVDVERMTFEDVPPAHWAWNSVEILYARGLTGGCNSFPLRYCPEEATTRAEMSLFLERAKRGTLFVPALPAGIFEDVPITHWAAGFIEQLYHDGITAGCNPAPLRFCPDNTLTRAEMAVFLLRAKYGSAYTPPPATGAVFADMPLTHWAAPWVERLYAEGLTGGCNTAPLRYCPSDTVSRAQLAVFLTKAFNLTMP